MSFWDNLPRPFFALAPLADVTDPALRALVARLGKPDILWTEFVSADGLYHTREVAKMPDAENPLMRDLAFGDGEHPIVAQFFTSSPEKMAYAAALAEKLGFDGVEINMGCPDSSIEKQGAGAALIKTPETARALIRAAKEATSLPVSVKTRIGFARDTLPEWLPELLAERPAALTVHLRTRKEMSLVSAHWERMPAVVALRDSLSPETRIIGNGDVRDLEDAREKAQESGADGVMLGRAIFGNPWVFAGRKSEDTSSAEKLEALIALAHGYERLSPPKHFAILKKHIKAFVTGFDGAAELRAKLMEAEDASALEHTMRENPL